MSSTDTGFTDEELEASQNTPINKIDDHLYLGSVDARNEFILKEHGIKRVIRIATEVEMLNLPAPLPEGIKETIFYLADTPSGPITPIILKAIPIIEDSIKEKENILIHCWAGVSRSASVIIGYLIKSKGMKPEEALKYVEKSRLCVWPNQGFWKQLQAL